MKAPEILLPGKVSVILKWCARQRVLPASQALQFFLEPYGMFFAPPVPRSRKTRAGGCPSLTSDGECFYG